MGWGSWDDLHAPRARTIRLCSLDGRNERSSQPPLLGICSLHVALLVARPVWVGWEEIERDQDTEDGAASNCPIFVMVIIKLLR